MKTIETTIEVDEQGKATIQLPPGVEKGRHRVVVVIEKVITAAPAALNFSTHDVGPWPANFTLRREEIYDDSGRGA